MEGVLYCLEPEILSVLLNELNVKVFSGKPNSVQLLYQFQLFLRELGTEWLLGSF